MADNMLWPNQFVNVRLLLDVKKNSIIVPSAAVQRGPQGTFVYLVKQDKTVEVRPVTVTLREGNQSAIGSGLQAGDVVVTDGQDKLQQGMTVVPQSRSPTPRRRRLRTQRLPHEPLSAVHSATGCNVAPDGGGAVSGFRRIPATARFGTAAG